MDPDDAGQRGDALEGVAGNTFASTQTGPSATNTWTDPAGSSATNNTQWAQRAFANNAQVFQALVSTTATMPELTTRISGLADNTYNVWVFFWDSSGGSGATQEKWNISAGLTSGSLSSYSFDGAGTTTSTVAASTLTYTTTPIFTTSTNITMYAVNLGQATVTGGGGTIDVFVDKLTGTSSTTRSWYDGVGYEVVPEPSSVALLGLFGGLALLRRRR